MSTRQTVTIQGPAERDQIARWARNVEAGTVVTFRKKSRSTEQNSKLHAMLGEVSKQVCWVGQYLDIEDWKDMFTASLRHARVVPGIDKGTYVPLGMHTSTLTIEEMSNLIELIYAFGADPEHPVIFKDPKDQSESGSPSSEPDTADAPPPASASEEVDTSPSAPSTIDPETAVLIRYARDVLPMAAEAGMTGAALAATEKVWADELRGLSELGKEKARGISNSMRAIFNGATSLDSALSFYSDALECSTVDLGGKADG